MLNQTIIVLLLLLICGSCHASEESNAAAPGDEVFDLPNIPFNFAAEEEYKPYQWYTRYPDYPDYCSTPETMAKRFIPPLPDLRDLSNVGETRLLHVTAVIRHGARTPWSSREVCWDGYHNATQDTSLWDCSLTTFVAPPDPKQVYDAEQQQQQGGVDATQNIHFEPGSAFFLFEKRYDALHFRNNGYTNEFNGTCQKGQLLLRGYEQELTNGRILRDAYAFQPGDYEHDERMRLINLDLGGITSESLSSSTPPILPWHPSRLRLRADDDQRTQLSGQTLLRGLFDEEINEHFTRTGTYPQIALHTADRPRDILDANERVCPRLGHIKEKARNSPEFQEWNSSELMESLRWYAHDKMGKTDINQILDCLMTTICTDRQLPEAVDDFGPQRHQKDNDNSMFEALAQADIQAYTHVIKYNDSEHSKLGMGPLWAEIMEQIEPWLEDWDPSGTEPPPAPQLSVFGAHDTTIMPLLASMSPQLWNDTDWPPYASMMLIEIHELIDGTADPSIYTTGFVFRLLYNGKVLTPLVPGCPADAQLCDVIHFKAAVDPIATRNGDCDLPIDKSSLEYSSPTLFQASSLAKTTEGILLFTGLVVLGLILGGLGTHVLLTGRLPCSRRQIYVSNIDPVVNQDDEEETLGLRADVASEKAVGNEDAFEDEPVVA